MKRLLEIKYWDYSSQRFNVKEYICLSSSAARGFLTIFLTEVVHRPIEHYILGLPVMVNIVLVPMTALLFVANTAESVKTASDLAKVLDVMIDMRVELGDIQVQMALLKVETSERVVETGEEAAARLDWIKSGTANHAAVFKDDTTECLNELAENTMEKAGGFVEGTVEKMGGLVENTAEKMARTAGRLSEFTEDTAVRVSGALTQRVGGVQQAIQRDGLNKGAVQERRDKLAVLPQRLVSISEKRHMFSSYMDFHRRDILKGNPTASSSRFAEALKELCEVTDRKDPDERHIR